MAWLWTAWTMMMLMRRRMGWWWGRLVLIIIIIPSSSSSASLDDYEWSTAFVLQRSSPQATNCDSLKAGSYWKIMWCTWERLLFCGKGAPLWCRCFVLPIMFCNDVFSLIFFCWTVYFSCIIRSWWKHAALIWIIVKWLLFYQIFLSYCDSSDVIEDSMYPIMIKIIGVDLFWKMSNIVSWASKNACMCQALKSLMKRRSAFIVFWCFAIIGCLSYLT